MMRRIWAALLVATFGITLIGPAVFASAADERLPPCCRSNGKHHCAMARSLGDSSGPAVQVGRCPLYAADQTIPLQPTAGMVSQPQAVFGTILSHPTPRPRAMALGHVAFDRSCQKRGPPFLA